MSEVERTHHANQHATNTLLRLNSISFISFMIGALGLLGVMLLDFAAVVGRHAGVPLLGSIELSEWCVVCMASASLLGTTLERGHASVHVLIEHIGDHPKRLLLRAANGLSALFFAFVLAGSLWLINELWRGDERSELLGLPIFPMRAIWCAAVAGMVACFAMRAFGRRRAP
jgi:TRAP-type C4-dicarboxylate transport system permease small subunit